MPYRQTGIFLLEFTNVFETNTSAETWHISPHFLPHIKIGHRIYFYGETREEISSAFAPSDSLWNTGAL